MSFLLLIGGCFLLCASKCAIWTLASNTTSRWTSCPWTPNATGLCSKWNDNYHIVQLLLRPHMHAPLPCRYVYHSSQWMVAGNTDHSCISPRLYVHPDSPCAGEMWMRQVISFDRVKLTNNEMDDKGHVGITWPVPPTPRTVHHIHSQSCTRTTRRQSRQQTSWMRLKSGAL